MPRLTSHLLVLVHSGDTDGSSNEQSSLGETLLKKRLKAEGARKDLRYGGGVEERDVESHERSNLSYTRYGNCG